jgi:uncharacterized membrane protein
MKTNLLKEAGLILILAIPVIYLALTWNNYPGIIPTHWNIHGEVDNYGSKNYLLIMMGINFGVYLLTLIIPKIDPRKKNYALFWDTYYKFRFCIVLFLAVISGLIMAEAGGANLKMDKIMVIAISLLFIVLGNYMGKLRPNFFFGIRTPWTIDNEEVWRRTHFMAGRIWFWTGLVCLVIAFFLPSRLAPILIVPVIVAISIIPIVYSFIIFKRLKKSH